ncbi:MAG: type I-F CRISPR-associated endoribonuclease Cas6/Csy4 [Desulfuromonadales bacterium]|nr:type I-F CRISPR-associated endoribonuclease Cas6/Csy4 [Desulfuromonadales bacterium]
MKYYRDISLLPNADIASYFIWKKLFQQIHLALAESKSGGTASAIGVGFPEYDAVKFALGTKLRLFAEGEQLLEQMQCEKWLNRLSDYVHVSSIKPVPEKVTGYACFKHIKLKGNKEKLARRRAKRKGETLQQALSHFADYEEPQSKLPFINMTSQTNGQHFRLFVEKKAKEQPQTGSFSCYGLSNTTTVPLF